MNKKYIIISIVIIIFLVGGGLAYKFYYLPESKVENTEAEVEELDLDYVLQFEVKLDNITGYQKEKEFKRFTDAKDKILKNIEAGKELNDNDNFYAWLEVALAQKIVGDYERAATIWKWFNHAYPHNSVSPFNLGGLYRTFVKDKEQAEKYYKIALEREKHKFQYYLGLHELYRHGFEDEGKAIDVLEQGLENNPDDKNYIKALISYLVKIGRLDEANRQLDKWLADHPEDYGLRAKIN